MIKGSQLMNTFLSSYSKMRSGTGPAIIVSGQPLPRASKIQLGANMKEIEEVESESKTVGRREDTEEMRGEDSDEDNDAFGRSPDHIDLK